MKTDDLHREILCTEIDEEVAREVALKQYSAGAMAKAVSEAGGDSELVQTLYIKHRTEELLLMIEREENQVKSPTAADVGETEQVYECLNCGFKGALKKEMPISVSFLLLLVPVLAYGGYILYQLLYNDHTSLFWLIIGIGMFGVILGVTLIRKMPEKGLCQQCRRVILKKCEPGD